MSKFDLMCGDLIDYPCGYGLFDWVVVICLVFLIGIILGCYFKGKVK